MELEVGGAGQVIKITSVVTRPYVMFLEGLYRDLAALSQNALVMRLITHFNMATRYVRELDLLEAARIREVATDVTALIGYLRARRVDLATASLQRQLSRKIERMPDLVREANDRDLRALPLGRYARG